MLLQILIFFTTLTESIHSQAPLSFTVKKFPEIFPGYRRMVVHIRNKVNISCRTNDPAANVTFTTIPELDYNTFKQHGQDFIVDKVSSHDAATYTCVATRNDEKQTLELGFLSVNHNACKENLTIENHLFKDVSRNVEFEKNEDVSIYCISRGDTGPETHPLSWTKSTSSGEISVNTSRVKNIVIKFEKYDVNKLKIKSAQKTHAGIYTCVRNLSAGCQKTDITRQSIKLLFEDPFEPEIIGFVTTSRVSFGSNLTLKCEVKASPTPDIRWLHGSKTIKNCTQKRTCILSLTGVNQNANYTCLVRNTEGTVKQTHNSIIYVSPTIKEAKYDASKGRVLTCEVIKGYPKPFVYWEKNVTCEKDEKCTSKWTNITTGTSYKMGRNDIDGTYELQSLNADDHGTFRCIAVNMIGSNYAELILRKYEKKGSTLSIAGIVIGLILSMIFICVLVIMCYRKYILKKYALYMAPDPKFHIDPDRTLFEQSIELPYDPEWEFPRERLDFIRSLGSGAFGQVFLAHAKGIFALSPRDKDTMAIRRRTRLRLNKKVPKTLLNCFLDDDLCEQNVFVAVKTLKANPSDVEYKDLASEIKVLIHLGNHENIVNILGACTRGGNLCAIMDFCPYGNLVHFLRDRRDIFSLQWIKQAESYEEDFCFFDAAHFALQIVRGMAFLSEKKVVHRDLAARNILVGSDYVIKIADFGLARDIYMTDFYLKESSGMLPVKWMAPESLFDKLYTVKSDVWSFGIVLWEICTMGGSPYPGLPMENLFEYLQAGNRMEKPSTCPDELYRIMVQCWKENRCERPFFHELTSQLESIMKSKIIITNNLATFERLRSFSDETDYLVPKSPAKKKKGSLDALLDMKGLVSFAAYRKKSAGNMATFPPMDDSINKENREMSPISTNRYVDLRSHDEDENKNESKCDRNAVNT